MVELISTSEAAERLGVSKQYIAKLVGQGKLHPVTPRIPGQSMWFAREEIERWKRLQSSLRKRTERMPNTPDRGARDSRLAMATNYFTLWELLGRSTSQASAAWNVLKTRISLVERLPNTVGKLIGCPQWDQRAVEVTHAKVSGYLDELSANDRVLPKDDPAYPRLLVGLPDAPEFLFVRGDNIDILNRPTIAIVGTRQPSEEGVRRAFKLASLLSSQGMVVASGLARGIDRAAHLGALSVGGSTVAVIGTPLTRVYPPEHWDLQEVIGRFGLVVSQFYPGAGIQRFYFPMRNAVMSGMSLGTVVIEASETSGALIQARQCLKQGRKLFIPQSAIDNPALSWPKTYQRRPGVHVFSTLDDLVEVLASEGLPQVGNLSTHLAPTTEVLRIE